ncbi:MAG: glycosyltransferase [Alphaproteobacteria bacterium]|nr:glycosyltransferase [Alphaproteobacteria bacterium]|tara:strand:+ start:386 stop:1303 length:918 start_codon:yes stop_codon:yes gene_type:complete
MKNDIVVQIPCLNEESTIGKVVEEFKKKLPGVKIIVYDNNSNDNSINLAKKSGAEVVVVKNRGKGNVVRRMFEDDINAKYFIMIDADDTYDITNIDANLKIMKNENFDMMVAKRVHYDSSAYRKGHIFGNYLFSKFVNIIFGNDITDIFSGFRIFSKRFIKTFPQNSSEFEIEAELTIHALEQKNRVGEFECIYKARPLGSLSKLNTYKDGLKILKLILILIKDEKPLLFFSIFSFLFLFLSLFIGIPIIHEFYLTGLVDRLPSAILSGLLMVISFLFFFGGLILDVIKKIRYENKRINFLLYKD